MKPQQGETDAVMVPAAAVAVALWTAAAVANPVFGNGIGARAQPDPHGSPGYYPAPYGGWVDDWAESYARARKLVEAMTLAEKTNITSGTGIFMGMCS